MGKATRWLKGLLGMNKERSNGDSSSSVSSVDRNEKKRWSFCKSVNDKKVIDEGKIVKDAAWLRSCYLSETERDQNKHAIAVAAATAAAADAAVAAAQAAVAVVRLTSHGRGPTLIGGGNKEWRAAVKIQTVFRGFLARKALRALKGLVKLQALVRGYLVRKRAAATLRSMQALIRAQKAVRSQRARRSLNKENRYYRENCPRKSTEKFEDARSEFHSKRLYASCDFASFNESPKIVEIDTYKPRSRSRRMDAALSECTEVFLYNGMSSPLPCPIPHRITIPDHKIHQDHELYFTADECKFSTAHSTPRFATSIRSNTPTTPAKSVCGENYFRPYSNYPSYMASTQSSNAKLRSHSAPKQRPEPGSKKRLTLNEIMASRNSISSIKMQRPCHEEGDEETGL